MQLNYFERAMHVKEVMQSVYALRLGTTVVIRVTLSSSPVFPSHLFFLLQTVQALMEFGLDLREKREGEGEEKK